MEKLSFDALIRMNGEKVLVEPFQENKFVKVGELNEMTVKTEQTQNGYMIHLCIKGEGGIYGIPESKFDKYVNNGKWIDIFAIE